jgi:hypothetical protein
VKIEGVVVANERLLQRFDEAIIERYSRAFSERQRSLEVEQPIRNRQVIGSTPIVGSMCKSFIQNEMRCGRQNVTFDLKVFLSHF